MPIYMDASRAGLIPIYMVAMLGIHMLIKGVSKAQRYSFILLNLILPAATILGLIQVCQQRLAVSILLLRGLISTPLSTYFSNLGLYYMLLNSIHTGHLVKL